MHKIAVILYLLCSAAPLHAASSLITEAEGSACAALPDPERALAEAKRQAALNAASYAFQQTGGDSARNDELTRLYTQAPVRLLEELGRETYRDAAGTPCVRVRLKAEVLPDHKSLEELLRPLLAGRPGALPLTVTVRTDRQEYRAGDRITLFLKGNKPFFARIVYTDAGGNQLQLLPNPHRRDASFDAGTEYRVPADGDRFDLEVTPPFGAERITVYAGTVPPGDLEVAPAGAVYSVNTPPKEIEITTRRIKPPAGKVSAAPRVAEFSEATALLTTRQGN